MKVSEQLIDKQISQTYVDIPPPVFGAVVYFFDWL